MTGDNQQLPDEIEKLLRKLTLRRLQNTSSLDIDELELFKWYSEETEHVLDKMLTAEHQYIQDHLDSGREDINDSGMVAVEYYLKRVRYSHVIYKRPF